MRCCPITISPEEWQHTSTELTSGTYYEFSVQGQVTFDGETKRGGALVFRYDTQPDPPTGSYIHSDHPYLTQHLLLFKYDHVPM